MSTASAAVQTGEESSAMVTHSGETAEQAPALFEPSTALTISPRQRELLNAATEIEQEDAREAGTIGYAARLWAQLTLPYKNPAPDTQMWVRRNGSLTLRVMPGLTGPKGAEVAGYPFGVLPRLILTWMSTEAVRMQSPELKLGNSLTDFIHRLGLSATGGVRGNITRLNDQMRRLLTSSMYVEDSRNDGTRWGLAGAHFSVAQSHRLWFDGDDRGGRNPLFGSTITLGEEFYQSIIAAPVPVDTRALAALAGSPMKMDLLVWLSHRLGYVRKTHLVPWALLAEQFGAEYTRARDFRADISKALREVLIVYPGANVQITDKGLLLSPSRTAVPRLA